MIARPLVIAAAAVAVIGAGFALVGGTKANRAPPAPAQVLLAGDGVVRVRSAYAMPETIDRLKRDIAGKGIMFFQAVDQTKLAAAAGIRIRPSTLLEFGNPALGTLFVNARAEAGLDWPVRLLVQEDEIGQVWLAYTDFAWIAQRHRITERDEPFRMASKVIASIAGSVAK